MLARSLLRRDPEAVRAGAAAKGETADVDRWLALDRERRARQAELDAARAERKRGRVAPKQRETELRERVAELRNEADAILLAMPNLPAPDVPRGGAGARRIVATHGEPRRFDFRPRTHDEIASALGILDLAAGARVAGAGFPALVGAGARLERALVDLMLDLHTTEQGYVEVSPPRLVRGEGLVAAGPLPRRAAGMYRIAGEDDLWLAPGGEAPLLNLHRGEVLDGRDLPLRYVAAGPCFRREAGGAGRKTRGLLRIRQFTSVHLMILARAHEAAAEHLRLRGHAEEVLRRLGLPYRVVEVPAGELSFASARTFDLEVHAPGTGRWLEVASIGLFGDFQARRARLRHRIAPGRPEFVHTMNGSGVALPRTIVAILENFQTEDGAVALPDVLARVMGGEGRLEGSR